MLLSSVPEAALLDRQFRLLREDFVGPLRIELSNLGIAAAPEEPAVGGSSNNSTAAAPLAAHQEVNAADKARDPMTKVQQQPAWLRLGSIAASSRNVYQSPAVLGVCLKPRPCVMVSIQLPPGHRTARMTSKKERQEYWSSYGHGMLPNGNE